MGETRLEYLERLLGDSADKHAKEIQAAHAKVGDLHAAIKSCAKSEHHSSLEKRIDYLEKFIGESADKAEQSKKDILGHRKDFADHKTSMETRLEYVERNLGDSSDRHTQEIRAAHAKLGDLHVAIKSCAKSDHHSSLEHRLNHLER